MFLKIELDLNIPQKNRSFTLWSIIHKRGYRNLKNAKLILKQLHKMSEEGYYDYKDGYGRKTRLVRYDFRIVEVTHIKDKIRVVKLK